MQTDSKKHFEEVSGIDLSKVEEMSKHIHPDGTPIDAPSEDAPEVSDAPEGSGQEIPKKPEQPKPQSPSQAKPEDIPEEKPSGAAKPAVKPKKDTAEVEAIMAKFYALQSSFVGQLDALKNSTVGAYKALPVGQRTIQKRAAMGRAAISQATALESQCDAQMSALLEELSGALKRAGMDQALVSDVRYYYASQKGYMKASYMSQFSKYLS